MVVYVVECVAVVAGCCCYVVVAVFYGVADGGVGMYDVGSMTCVVIYTIVICVAVRWYRVLLYYS